MKRIEPHRQQLGGLKKVLDMWTNWLLKTALATPRGQKEMGKVNIGSSHAIRMVPHSLERMLIIQTVVQPVKSEIDSVSNPSAPSRVRPSTAAAASAAAIVSSLVDQRRMEQLVFLEPPPVATVA